MAKRRLKRWKVRRLFREMQGPLEDAKGLAYELWAKTVTNPEFHSLTCRLEAALYKWAGVVEQAVGQLRAGDGPETQLTLKFG